MDFYFTCTYYFFFFLKKIFQIAIHEICDNFKVTRQNSKSAHFQVGDYEQKTWCCRNNTVYQTVLFLVAYIFDTFFSDSENYLFAKLQISSAVIKCFVKSIFICKIDKDCCKKLRRSRFYKKRGLRGTCTYSSIIRRQIVQFFIDNI